MKRTVKWIIIITLAIGLLFLLRPKNKTAGVKIAKGRVKPVLVDGLIVSTKPQSKIIKVSGSILSNEEVNLMSQISGIIKDIHFTEGSHVKKGDLLVKIDDAPYQAQLKKDKVTLNLYRITEERQKKLLAINAISQQDYDVALNNLQSVRADMKIIEVSIGYCSIRAPFDGIIGLKNVSPGSYITPSTIIADLEEISPLKIDFYVPEIYVSHVHRGDSITFSVSGYDKTFNGFIFAIDPKIDANSGSIHIRALSANKNEKLLPGEFANVTITLTHLAEVIMIPTEAVIPKVIGQSVYVSKRGKAVSVPIELGSRTDSTVEVTKGLKPGDTIITRGSMLIYPGSLVKFKQLR